MKTKINGIFKKFQSYSFIIFLLLVLGAFFALAQLNNGTDTNIPTDNPNNQNPNVVKVEDEEFLLPMAIAIDEEPVIVHTYYDVDGSVDDQLNAIIVLPDGSSVSNEGVNYQNTDGTAFDVLASLSGTVKSVTQDSLMGHTIVIEHLYDVTTVYTSLASVDVAVGDKVEIGDKLGVAGESNYDPSSGVHVHFEIKIDGVTTNPIELIGTKISALNEEQE